MTLSIPGKRQIYEKTLELNVCAEILAVLRTQPGYSKAVWQGLTQAQERSVGLDAMLRNLGPGRHLLLQFKAPWTSSQVDSLYKFSLNTQQHQTLEADPARRYSNAVFYVLPLFTSWSKVNKYAPNLIKDTWLLRVRDVNSSALGLRQQRHRLEVDKSSGQPKAYIFSPEIDSNLINAAEAFHSADSSLGLQGLIPSESLLDWVGSVSVSYPPDRFRGLHSLFVPA